MVRSYQYQDFSQLHVNNYNSQLRFIICELGFLMLFIWADICIQLHESYSDSQLDPLSASVNETAVQNQTAIAQSQQIF